MIRVVIADDHQILREGLKQLLQAAGDVVVAGEAGDGFEVPLPFPGSVMPDRTVLDAQAAQILAALRDPMRPTPRASAAVSKK